MRCLLMMLVVVGLVSAREAADKELDKFQGKWELTSSEKDGKKQSAEMTRTVTGSSYTMTVKGKEAGKGTIKVDASASPKAIDIVREGGKPMLGIYAFEGEEQKVCFAPPGKERPKEFTSKDGNTLSVWKRVK